MNGQILSYVALVARDTVATGRFLGEALGLQATPVPLGPREVTFYGVGGTAIAVFEATDPWLDAPVFPGVHHMALAAPDPVAAAGTLPVVLQGTGPGGRRFAALDPAATAGVRTRFAEPLDIPCRDGPVIGIDHLGIACADEDDAIRVFVDTLGCPLESSETDLELRSVTESFVSDRYGAVFHSRPPHILGGLRAVFATLAGCELEFLSDAGPPLPPGERPPADGGSTRGDRSAIARFIDRHGPGLAHIALATGGIDALLARLAGDGWRMIDHEGRPGGRGSLIGFVHPQNFGGGLLIHFVEPASEGGYAGKFA